MSRRVCPFTVPVSAASYCAAGLFEASSHSGRRTFASRLMAAGESLEIGLTLVIESQHGTISSCRMQETEVPDPCLRMREKIKIETAAKT